MSIEVQAVQRIRAFSEATFGADSSASIGSFTDLPIIEGTAQMTLTRDELDPGQLVQHIDEGRERVLGKRSATLTFQMNLAPTGTAAASGVTSITSPLGMLLKAIMGGQALAAGTTAGVGSTATSIVCTLGTPWEAGSLIGWANSAGVVEWREVESRSSNTLTLKRGFSGSPASTNALYNTAMYYFTAHPDESLAMLVEGLESDDRWLLTGGQATGGFTIAIDVTGGTIPRATFTLTFARWYDSTETASSITGTLGTATYTATNPIVGETGIFEVWTVGAPTFSTTQAIHVSAMTWEPHVAFGPYTSPSGINTVKRWIKTRNTDSPVQGSFTMPYESATWWTARNNRSDLAVQYVAGVAAGSAVILSAPTVQPLNPQRVADAAGLAAQTIMWKGRRDIDVGSSTNDPAKSPFRIFLG